MVLRFCIKNSFKKYIKITNVACVLKKAKNSSTFFKLFHEHHCSIPLCLYYILILRFDYFAWNCEVVTLLNFRDNMIYASPFLIFVKKFPCVAIHSVHISITFLLA
jgi:hypothetical protein